MTQRDRTAKDCRWIALPFALLSAGAVVGFVAGLLGGCGAPAAPQPPTLNLPQPVNDLAAKRVGDAVHLIFSVPQKTTDKLPVRGAMTASLCRSVDSGPCQPAGTLAIPAQQKASSMDDHLPPELSQEPPRLLTYKVSILNHAAKSGGESAPAYTVSGPAPLPVTGLSAAPQRKGIILSWQVLNMPGGTVGWIRFDRTRTSAPPAPVQPLASARNPITGRKTTEEPAELTLHVPDTAVDHHPVAVDATAHTGSSYRYIAQRVQEITLAGRTMEIDSPPSTPAEAAYRDVFPPPVPMGLVSAADTAAKAIDLNWAPDVDPALAGYIVYRRALGSPVGITETPQRISPAGKPVTTSNWSDTTAVPGQRYAYSISAIDLSGNESQRSIEVEDEWNMPSSPPNPQSNPSTSSKPNQHLTPHP
jgi:hypothetical protein